MALAVAAPALCLGQDAGSTGEGTATPSATPPAAVSAPGAGAPAAVMPGAAVPGGAVPLSGLAGLSSLPTEYTNYDVSAGLGETDNVNFSNTHPRSQTLSALSAFFDFIRSSSYLDVNAVGNFSDTDYLEGAYGNKVLGRFDGIADLTLWDRHFKWLVRDDYGDQQIDVLQSLTPLNLQRVNIFSTGPDLTLQPTLSTFVEMQALYSRNSWQDEPFSGNTDSASLTLGRQTSSASSISVVGQVQQEHFDNRDFNTNYEVREYYGHYNLRGVRTRIDLQGGVAQANDKGAWTSTPLLRASLGRDVSPYSSVSIGGGREYNNAMGSFAALANGVTGGIPVSAATQTTGNALRTYGNVNWDYHRQRTTIDLFGNWNRESYDVQSKFDFTQTDIGLNLGRQITPRLSANITTTVDRGQYGNQGFTNTYGTVGAGVVYHPGTWVVVYSRYDHQFRRASGVAQGNGFDENRIFVMIGYYPHSSGTGLPRGMGGYGSQ